MPPPPNPIPLVEPLVFEAEEDTALEVAEDMKSISPPDLLPFPPPPTTAGEAKEEDGGLMDDLIIKPSPPPPL